MYSTGPSGGSGPSFVVPKFSKTILDGSGPVDPLTTLTGWTVDTSLARGVDVPGVDQGEDTLEAVSKVKMEAMLLADIRYISKYIYLLVMYCRPLAWSYRRVASRGNKDEYGKDLWLV